MKTLRHPTLWLILALLISPLLVLSCASDDINSDSDDDDSGDDDSGDDDTDTDDDTGDDDSGDDDNSDIPAAPSELKAYVMDENEIVLHWVDNSNNEDGFRIYRSVDTSDLVPLAGIDPDQVSLHDAVERDHRYRYSVSAFNAEGESAMSEFTEANTFVRWSVVDMGEFSPIRRLNACGDGHFRLYGGEDEEPLWEMWNLAEFRDGNFAVYESPGTIGVLNHLSCGNIFQLAGPNWWFLALYRFHEGAWETFYEDEEDLLLAAAYSSPDNIFLHTYDDALGTYFVLHHDGDTWTTHEVTTPYMPDDPIGSTKLIEAVGPETMVMAHPGHLTHFDAGAFSQYELELGERILSFWSDGVTHFMATENGVTRFDGEGWDYDDLGTNATIYDLWGDNGSDVFGVGSYGTVIHFDGSAWEVLPTPTSNWLHGVWGSGPDDVFAVGEHGTVIHYDGSEWSRLLTDTQDDLILADGTESAFIFTASERAVWQYQPQPE